VQALAAVLGGAQSLHCNGRDEALALPTEESARIALRTQQILAAESGVANTVDPVGGSWAIESRTAAIEDAALAWIRQIDEAGGVVRAIERGDIQRHIQDAAFAAQQAVEHGDQVIVGVNRYATEESPDITVLRVDPDLERRQIETVNRLRRTRDDRRWQDACAAVASAARLGVNLVPPIIAAVEARATVGEIADVLRTVFGEHREP
jgi:methylmalonyl-CoA mutase N-terminal domain/subunit